MLRNLLSILLIPLFFVFAGTARAALTIEIVGGAAQQIPVAVVPFEAQPSAPTVGQTENLANIINADLRRSGLFRALETRGVANQPHEVSEVKFAEWSAIQAQALVIGKVELQSSNRLRVSFRLLDVLKQTTLASLDYDIAPSQLRSTAHKIADVVYEKLTGEKAIFDTRIAYVVKQGSRYQLQVADADGGNAQTVLSSSEPVISPAWSPDGTRLAYVSFEKKKPVIFSQSLVTGQRQVLANFKGNNSAPAWSPDGTRLAIVLTYGANSQVYVINADGTGVRQLSRSSAIDTEPGWSPDGKWIYFSSDRGGSPQIYRMSTLGGDAQRVTYEGSYNVSPRLSPDGKWMTFIRREGGRFRVAQQELATGQAQLLSETAQDESPSFAPNGKLILYATHVNGRGVLSVVSADGRTRQRLSETAGGDVREPAWGPWAN